MTRAAPSPTVIAVDGGGTRCRLALDGPAGRHDFEVGAANVTSDFKAAVNAIRAGLAQLAEAAGHDPATLARRPAYLGLAGVTDAALAARVVAALPFSHAKVEDDRRCALRGALGPRDGAIAHCGTGSFFALQHAGEARLAGGWGSRLGDEGSAFWIGRAALSATLETVDGLTPPTELTRTVLARFSSPAGIVAFAARATPTEIGALARLVTSAAEAGDTLACKILQASADHIARVVTVLGWRPGMALCLTGGLGPAYRDYLPTDLKAALVMPDAAPIDGAIALARDFAREQLP